jgi:carbonic anhydrase
MTVTPDPTALDRFVYSQQPGYDETATRAAFNGAVPLRTIVIYCYDPRAAAIPSELAKLWPDETYPGDLILDFHGNKVGSTATIFPIVVAGGRAVDALRSITIGHHLFGLQNIVVVHHTNCGTSSFTPQGLLDAYLSEEGVDLSDTYGSDSLAIGHLATSLRYDVDLLRKSPAVPGAANIFGMVFDIDRNEFSLLIPATTRSPQLSDRQGLV